MKNTLYACLTKDPLHHNIINKHNDVNSDIHIVRAAFQKSLIWPQNSTIKIAFAQKPINTPDDNKTYNPQYTKEKADWVEKVVEKYWAPFINLKFVWGVPIEDSDVRISFIPELGAFSLVGTEALKVTNKDTITMNLGWLDQNYWNTDNKEDLIGTGVVVVHEFGHLLGLIHEHQRPDIPFKWNTELVYASLEGKPNYWSKEQVDNNIFNQPKMTTLNASKFDKYSVMQYIFPNNFFISPPNLIPTKYLSNLDIVWANKTYPDPSKPLPKGMTPNGLGRNPFGGSEVPGTDPRGTDPRGTDPSGTNPSGTDPSGTDPSGTNPSGTDPSGTDPSGTDPSGTDNKSWLKKYWIWILILILILTIIIVVVVFNNFRM